MTRIQLALLWLYLMHPTAAQTPTPPVAAKRPHTLIAHEHERVDDYYWLRDRENPEVIQLLEQENAYREAVMADTVALQEQLFNEIKSRIKQDDESAGYPDRGYVWFSRTQNGQQYAIHYRRKLDAEQQTPIGPEELVLDENRLAEGHEFCEVGDLQVSRNCQLVAWPVDFVGRRMFDIQVLDMASGEMLAETIPSTSGNFFFAEDDQHLFYTRQDPNTLRYDRLFCHRLGSDPAEDRLVYFEPDEEFNLFLVPTKSRRYLQCVSMQTLSTEVRLIDTANPHVEPIVFLPREDKHEYSLDHLHDRFVIVTNWQARNFRVMEATLATAAYKDQWTELLPHDNDVLVEDVELLGDWLVTAERTGGLTRMRYRRFSETVWQTIDFGEPCYSAVLAATSLPESSKLRYAFSSLKTPHSIIDFDLATGMRTLVKQDPVLGGFDADDYVTERLMAPAGDGTLIPISLVRHRDTKIDGTAPLMQYAYGSYGISMEAEFIASIFNLVNRGFVYAIAHIRGGQEMGRHWYESGKLLHKQNTFTDFIDCTRYLTTKGYANPRQVFAQGGSAGGLLMGAVANMAPDLYTGIIAEVPFVDVVTTMLDETIPLTTSEYDEWGNPNQSEFYHYMLSYSPYDNVRPQAYPNILVITGFHDSQVQYWEPAKWVAKLRELKTDDHLLLFDIEMHAGHGGSSGRYDRYQEIAKMQAFVLKLTGSEFQ